ncbi:MAG TPA: hypothetical protein VIO13_11090 [Candidatus Dormibacteraeota bacterium]
MAQLRAVRTVAVVAVLLGWGIGVSGGATTAHAASAAPSHAVTPAGRLPAGVMPMFGAGGGSGRSPAASSTAAPSPHLNYYGGRVISRVHVIQVLYGNPGGAVMYEPEVQNTTASPSIAGFYGGITNSAYVDSMSEYSTTGRPQGKSGTNETIDRGVFDTQVVITPSAANDPFASGNNSHTIDDSQIQDELGLQMPQPLPAPTKDSNHNLLTLYAVYFPHGVTITIHNSDGTIDRSGHQFCAYHGTAASPEFYYSVLPDFSTGLMSSGCGNNPTEFQNVTAVSSHELAEAITDPEVGLSTSATVGLPLAWYDPNNGENGDICNGQDATTTGGDGVTYTVQQIWSNQQGACVVAPAPRPPHFAPQGVGAPQAAVTPDGKTQLVFWKGSNNVLAEAWYTGYWNGPITFPQLGSLASTPSVAVTKDGSTQLVFWQGPGGHLFEAWYSGSWHGPVDWTAAWGGRGLLASAPSVVTTKDGQQLAFWRGTDGHLWEAWYSGGFWYGPSDFSTLGTLASAPSAAITPDGTQQLVFWQGTDNRLTEVWYAHSWNGPVEWTGLGSISSPPSVTVTTDGSTQLVFYRSPAGHLLESWYTGSWHGSVDWTTNAFGGNGALTSSPSATVTPDGSSQLVFWQGAGATLWEGWYAGGAWHGPVNFSAR